MPDSIMKTNKEYIKYIKSQACSVCGALEVDAHHMDFIGMGGNRKKPSLKDFSCVSLCRMHHTEYHSYNLRGFYCE